MNLSDVERIAKGAGTTVKDVEAMLLKTASKPENLSQMVERPGGSGAGAIAPRGPMMEPTLGTLTASFQDPPQSYYTDSRGVREVYLPMRMEFLKATAIKCAPVAIGINHRAKQVQQYMKQPEQGDLDAPGFLITLRETEKNPNSEQKKKIKYITNFMLNTGRRDFPDHEDREDMLPDFAEKMVRDYFPISRGCAELRFDKMHGPVDFWAVDGATIRRVVKSGYGGEKQDFDPRVYVGADQKTMDRIASIREALIPPMNEIRFVQEIDGRFRAAFSHKNFIFDTYQRVTDLKLAGHGISPVEQALSSASAYMLAMAYNMGQFDMNRIPKVALAMKKEDLTVEELQAMQEEWIANFTGMYGYFRIPFLRGDVEVLDLYKSPRDMEFKEFTDHISAVILSLMGIDSAEVGLRLQGAQNVMNENLDARQKFSKDRGLLDILMQLEGMFNKIMIRFGWGEEFVFKFTGLVKEDRKLEAEIDTSAVKSHMTVNELRKRKDMKPIEGGDMILDPAFLQAQQMAAQQAQAEQQPSIPSGDEMGGMVDEAFNDEDFDSLFKAALPAPSNMRTVLR